MIYTTKERNNAILLIAAGKTDLSNTLIYERLEEFKWVVISRLNGIIKKVELSNSGEDLNRRLLKQQAKENDQQTI